MNNFINIFIGTSQSKYAFIAILLAIVITLCVILFDSSISINNALLLTCIILLISLPGIVLSLLQLTCIVTGSGNKLQRWWCSAYAWVLTGIIIYYAACVIIASIFGKTLYKKEYFETSTTLASTNIPPPTTLVSTNTSNNITSSYDASDIQNRSQGASNIPQFARNNSLTYADILNSG